MARIAVVGAGSFGTSLSISFANAGHDVSLWCYETDLAEAMTKSRENHVFLPGVAVPDSIHITPDVTQAVAGKSLIFGVTPSFVIRDVFGRAVPHLEPDAIVVNASKGLEDRTLERVDQIYAEVLPESMAKRAGYLSGPTFAKEIAEGLPAAIVIASTDPDTVTTVQAALSSERFRVYSSDDIIGVLIGGALKNVVAIAAGTSDGLGFGLNARAALITRGLAEISRVGIQQGANPLTFAGLSGMGDLVLTCSGDLSRNRRVGLALGRGQKLEAIIAEMRMVAEGVKTTKVAYELTRKLGVSAPITEFMYQVLYEDRPARDALAQLTQRSPKSELE